MQDVLEAAFLYSPDLTPAVTSFSPVYGPKLGGTIITFQGKNLLPGSALQDTYDGWFSEGSSSTNTSSQLLGRDFDDQVASRSHPFEFEALKAYWACQLRYIHDVEVKLILYLFLLFDRFQSLNRKEEIILKACLRQQHL